MSDYKPLACRFFLCLGGTDKKWQVVHCLLQCIICHFSANQNRLLEFQPNAEKEVSMEQAYEAGYMVIADRFLRFVPDIMYWDGEPVSNDDIQDAYNSKQEPCSEPYGDGYRHIPRETKTKEWHVSRILYFVHHPEEIRDIDVDNECDGNRILPYPLVVDGGHRVFAARFLGIEKFHIQYGGRLDLLDYLIGASDVCPENWL